MTETTPLERLQQRVHDGIVWLDEHDPKGVFHIWFEAGLTPASRIPDVERQEAYAAYYPARRTFERLDGELSRLEQRERSPLGDPRLQPQPPREKR